MRGRKLNLILVHAEQGNPYIKKESPNEGTETILIRLSFQFNFTT